MESPLPPPISLILLHGLGADGSDMAGLAKALALPGPVRLICPDAPVRPITLNGGYAMRGWFDITGLGPDDPVDADGIAAAFEQARAWIDAERAAGVPAGRIVLGGFSQGGVVALHAALRYPEPLGAVLALSTWLPLRDALKREHSPAALATPIFMAHGTHDDVVRLSSAERARDALRDMGCRELLFKTYPMTHSISMSEVADMRAMLAKHLA
ncbi:MAG: alpha/beta fold hydrolase [Pseudomonadota bacterium]